MACAEANMNMPRLKHLLGETEVNVMLVGAHGAGKSSLINSMIKLVNSSDISHNKISRYIPTAKSPLMGGHTVMRESVKLADTLRIVDNRGWHDWGNEASLKELTAQINGQRALDDIVDWNITEKEWTSIPYIVSEKIDCVAVVLNGRFGIKEINHIDKLMETCRRNIMRRPTFMVTHKDLITEEDAEKIRNHLDEIHGIAPEEIFFIRNIITESDVLDAESKECLSAFIEVCIDNGIAGAASHRRREELLREVEQLEDEQKEEQIFYAKRELESMKSLVANGPRDIETEVEIQLLQERVNILEIERNHAQELKAVKREFSEAWLCANKKIRYFGDENKSLQSMIRELEEKTQQSLLSSMSIKDANASLQKQLQETDLALESAEKDLKKLEQEKRQNERELTKYENEKISNETNLIAKEQLIQKLDLHVLELKESIQKAEQATRSQEIARTSQKEQFELRILELKENIQREEAAHKKLEKERSQNEREQARLEEVMHFQKADLKSKEERIEKLELSVLELKNRETAAHQELEKERSHNKKERAKYEEQKSSQQKMMEDKEQRIEQLERESWKLRTKIQLESEIRSAERKRRPKWIQTVISMNFRGMVGKPSTDDSSDQFSESNLGEEQTNDEFADILKQIADDLYDEDKIESLGGQLGILQGDIQRALMTNVKFNRVTSQGTRHMLKQWRRDVSSEDERIELRRALEAAKLKDLADRYIPQGRVKKDVEQSDSADYGSGAASQAHEEKTQYDVELDPEVNKEAGSGNEESKIFRQMKESPKTKGVKETASRQESEGRERPIPKGEFVASTQNSPEKATGFTSDQEQTTKNEDEVSSCQTGTRMPREWTRGREVESSTGTESVVFGKDDVIEEEGKDLSLDRICEAENAQERSISLREENYQRLEEENEKIPRSNSSSSGNTKKLTPCCMCC